MVKCRWQFCWCNPDDPPKNGDAHDWHTKSFRVATFERAMDKMLDFVKSKPFECHVDYECCAEHVQYRPDGSNHKECFFRIDQTKHELREYVK